jgi:GTP-binding protein YchF
METLNLELIFADMETVQKRGEKARKLLRNGEKKYQEEADAADKMMATLESGQPARLCPLTPEEHEITKGWFLLTDKPVIYAANVAEDELGKPAPDLPLLKTALARAEKEHAQSVIISARIEEEIAGLPKEEQAMYIEELGIGESGLDRLIKASYSLLGLISFLTAGEDECRAWTITRGTRAPQAAGKIHTDFERGFIRAEIVPYPTLMAQGSMAACREKGLVQSCGKDYVMQDGDVTLFRFNV